MTTTKPTNGRTANWFTEQHQNGSTGTETSGNAVPEGFPNPAELDAQRNALHALHEVANDPIFGTARSKAEMNEDRKVDEQIRAKQRQYRLKHGLAAVDNQARHDEAQAKLDEEDRKEQISLRKAQRKRKELTDGGAALASAYRKYRMVTTVLSGVTVAGIVWASWNVAQALGGATPALGYYLVEPLFSLPLVCIVIMQITAAMHGWLHKVAPVRRVEGKRMPRLTGTGWIELALLSGSAFLLAWPELTGAEVNPEHLVAKMAAPALITISVGLQYVAADLFGGIIREAWLSGDDSDANLRERVRKANELVARVKVAMAEGSIPVQEDGFPSVSAIQKRFPCEKLTAQCARDALLLFREEVQ